LACGFREFLEEARIGAYSTIGLQKPCKENDGRRISAKKIYDKGEVIVEFHLVLYAGKPYSQPLPARMHEFQW
jgi:hypothetical protein